MKKTAARNTMLSPVEIAARLDGPAERAIRRWCEKGLVEHRKYPSGQIFIPLAEVERLERESHRPRIAKDIPEPPRMDG